MGGAFDPLYRERRRQLEERRTRPSGYQGYYGSPSSLFLRIGRPCAFLAASAVLAAFRGSWWVAGALAACVVAMLVIAVVLVRRDR